MQDSILNIQHYVNEKIQTTVLTMCHHRHTWEFKNLSLNQMDVRNEKHLQGKSDDATVAQTVSFWGGEQRMRGWGSWPWPLGHDLSLRHDLVTPLLRVICQGVLRHPQTFNVRAWLERKAARVFRGRSCTKRPCTPGSGHFSQCWAQQHEATIQPRRTRDHFKFKLFFPGWTSSIWIQPQCATQWTRDTLLSVFYARIFDLSPNSNVIVQLLSYIFH